MDAYKRAVGVVESTSGITKKLTNHMKSTYLLDSMGWFPESVVADISMYLSGDDFDTITKQIPSLLKSGQSFETSNKKFMGVALQYTFLVAPRHLDKCHVFTLLHPTLQSRLWANRNLSKQFLQIPNKKSLCFAQATSFQDYMTRVEECVSQKLKERARADKKNSQTKSVVKGNELVWYATLHVYLPNAPWALELMTEYDETVELYRILGKTKEDPITYGLRQTLLSLAGEGRGDY